MPMSGMEVARTPASLAEAGEPVEVAEAVVQQGEGRAPPPPQDIKGGGET